MARVLGLVFSVCLLMVVGCGGTTTNPVQADCDAIVTQDLCPVVVDTCGYVSFSECVNTAELQLGCGAVLTENGAAASACDSDINSAPCGYFFDPYGNVLVPNSCLDAFY
jgi:hypothetical protein